MNNYELFCLKRDFDNLYNIIVNGIACDSRVLSTSMIRYYDTIADVTKLVKMSEELLNRKTNRIIRLKQELHKSNKNSNKYYTALKSINELCSKNSCTANPEYLSDLLYEIERNVVDALSDSPKTCKTKD